VDYVVDYGTSECTDKQGNPSGTTHAETRGWVHYAPGVGPVSSSEDFIPVAAQKGTCAPPEDVGRVTHRNTRKFVLGTVPVIRATWGRVKTMYR
jgi:hypothetical protein